MVVTRFAPSPTGYLHIGGLRTALFNWLWARKNSGKFLLRIEDTDLSRNSEDAMKAILEAFDWVGLNYDEEPIYQSKRFDIYKKYIDKLLQEGKAYKCYMSKEELDKLREEQIARGERPRYDRRYRDFKGTPPAGVKPVIRIKAPLDGVIEFEDGIKGKIKIDASEVDDFIIARSDGSPTYNFVVAIDDYLMGLTDVIRGDDHLYNTPKQLVVYNALGFKPPKFYHVPLIHNEKGKKLSKRDGALDVMEYKKEGFLPEALINFLVRLGWSHGDQEIFSIDELLELFDPKDINKSASSYNLDKLLWLNAHYIKNSSNERLVKLLKDFGVDLEESDKIDEILEATKSKAKTLKDLAAEIKKILTEPKEYDKKAIKKAFKGEAKELLEEFLEELKRAKPKTKEEYHNILQDFVAKKEIGFGKIGQPLRVALIGNLSGPGLDEAMYIIGLDEVERRVEKVLEEIE
ncbi:MAG: glutamate--tRNA ligase [Epsilonproteobacteria bacterium]|nr:glutamate--tRNA ligase [Campylobacterota bacterium]